MNQRIWIKKLAVFLLAFVLLTGQVFAVPINVSAAKVRKLNAKKVIFSKIGCNGFQTRKDQGKTLWKGNDNS